MNAFRDERQRTEACRALLATGGLERYWTSRGPSAEARALAKKNGASLSPGERALLLAACAFWTGEAGPLRFDELIGLPEAEPISKLTTATRYGPRAVDVWLARSSDTEGFSSYDEAEVHERAAKLFDEARSAFGETGDDAMNFHDAPDACAIGAYRMASFLLCEGASPVEDEDRRVEKAIALTLHVLGMSAADAKNNARAVRKRSRRRRTSNHD